MKLLRALTFSLGVVNAVEYSRSFQSSSWGGNNLPSHHSRSSVNNCGGNCCRGWASGRSGSCTIKMIPINGSSRSSSSPSSYSFSYSGSPPNTAVSWSSNSRGGNVPNKATFQAYASVSQNQPSRSSRPSRPISNYKPTYRARQQDELGLCYETLLTTDEQCGRPVAGRNLVTYDQCCATVGKAWGPKCTHCNQSPQQDRRAKCPRRYTPVGNSCRMLQGPASAPSPAAKTQTTSDCYRVGDQVVCPGAGGGVAGDQMRRDDTSYPAYVADVARPDLTYDFDDQYSNFVDVIDVDDNLYDASDYGSQRFRQYEKQNPSMEYLRPSQQSRQEQEEPFYGEKSWTNWESWGSAGSTYSENRRPGSSYRSRERGGQQQYNQAAAIQPIYRNQQAQTQEFYNQVYNTGKNLLNNANAWLGQATHRNSGGCQSGCG